MVIRMARFGRIRAAAYPAGQPVAIEFSNPDAMQHNLVAASPGSFDKVSAGALKMMTEPDGMAKVALKLGAYRKLDPTPFEEFIFFDHPSGRARIRMAMDWKAANLPAGESASGEIPRNR